MTRIPRTEERPVKYMMSSAKIMEPWEAFTNRAMRQPSVRMRLPMKAKPLKVEPKGWGDNVIRVTLAYMQ
jgi:hypothetical protein